MHHRRRSMLIGLVAATLLAMPGRTATASDPLERFTAFAVDMSGVSGRTRAGTVDIVIERWSTDREREQLLAALRERGPDGLLAQLSKVKERAGYIRSATSLGYPLRFAHQFPLASGGRRILIATDRPVSFLEIRNQARTMDYPFLVIDIRVDESGQGQGKLLPLARITASDDQVIEIENYAAEPVRLTKVRKVG